MGGETKDSSEDDQKEKVKGMNKGYDRRRHGLNIASLRRVQVPMNWREQDLHGSAPETHSGDAMWGFTPWAPRHLRR